MVTAMSGMQSDPDIGNVRDLLARMAPPPGAPRPSLAERRAQMDAFFGAVPLPDGCTADVLHAGDVPARRYRPANAESGRVLLYLHGGGYHTGSSLSHGHLAARLAEAAGMLALALDYRLAPEHPFPAGLDDALAAYRWLLASGFQPKRIAIAGDSAGGGLALALWLALKRDGLPPPAALLLLSPWTDLSQSGPSYAEVGGRDPILTKDGLDALVPSYAGEAAIDDPLISPIRGDFTGAPPMMVLCGGEEILVSDSVRLAEVAGLAGVETRLEVWPEMIHVWPIFHQILGAGRRAIAESGAWLKARTTG